MADRIKLLPEVVANQIAAGEVVNRPSSVVKEMMENAIDAGARSVKVNFRDGGKELIQIVDDGCGMSPIDARMAFDRHATSKISSLDDIYALKTFGFRGEALASIAAVSQVELRTRQAEDEVGTLTTVNGGEFVSQTLAACPVGSQFYVRNLFYNVPARRKFLEKSTTSTGQIKSEFQRVALCNPQVGFELLMNDQPLYRLPAASLASRIVDVVGRHIKQNLLEVDADTSIVRVTGFVGRPAAAKKSNSSEQYLFVNGRYFRSPYFFKAILKAYEKLIPDACSPSYFLYLTIDPSRIDVNVHPQKTESKQQTEHGTRSSDRRHHQGHHTDIAIAVFQPADQQLQHPGTDAAHHVVGQKALRPQLVFERTTEHPQGEHIEKQVGKSTVQKHISHQLVGMEQRTLDVEKRQRPDDSVPDRQQLGRKKHQRIDDNQVQHYGRRRRKIAAIIHRQSKI